MQQLKTSETYTHHSFNPNFRTYTEYAKAHIDGRKWASYTL